MIVGSSMFGQEHGPVRRGSVRVPVWYIPGIGIPGIPFLGLGQDRLRLDPGTAGAVAGGATTAALAAGGGPFPWRSIAAGILTGVGVWAATRVLDRMFGFGR